MRRGFDVAKHMPKLGHWIDREGGQPFDIRKSEAAKWLCSQPEIMAAVFDICKTNHLIAYDKGNNMWHGVGGAE